MNQQTVDRLDDRILIVPGDLPVCTPHGRAAFVVLRWPGHPERVEQVVHGVIQYDGQLGGRGDLRYYVTRCGDQREVWHLADRWEVDYDRVRPGRRRPE